MGAGAVGGHLGARLAASGVPTSALARGDTRDALRAHGWRLETPDGSVAAPVAAVSDEPADLGVHDVVVLATKAHALSALAERLAPLIGPGTVVLPALNGVPWWFFDGVGGAYDGLALDSVDPSGRIAAHVPGRQVLGAVLHFSASVRAPGHVVNHAGRRLVLGEPTGGVSDRVREVAATLRGAGFEVEESAAVRTEVWYKLWGNMTMNPVSALTGATMDRILDDELVRGLVSAVMEEAKALGAEIGCPITETVEDRMAVTRSLGAVKTSMLQDAEAGRVLELDAMLTAVLEIADRAGTTMPSTGTLLGLTRLAARSRGLYPG